MAYYEITDTMSASHVSLPSDIHDPESDRLRLGRELARDFGHDSFSSNSSRGGANDNNNEEETDTLGSFDISRDARGTSTRRVDMLQHTPPTDSRLFSQEFADFTMAGRDDDDDEEITDSMEMGRGDNNNSGLRSVDFSSYIPFSIGAGSGKKQDRKMSSFFSTASPNPPARLQSISSTHSDPSEYLQASKRKNGAPTTNNKPKEKAKLGRESRGLGGLTGFDLSQLELSTPKNNSRGRTRLGTTGTGTGASKISDFVSNSGSGGSRSRFQGGQSRSPRDEHGDTASDAGSVSGRARPSNTRFTSSKPRQVSSSSVPGGGARGNRMTKDDDLTADVPTIVAKARKTGAGTDKAIPKSFKSTDAFLEELGLDGHTTTNDLKERLDKLKDVDAGRAPGLYKPSDETIGITQQSFLLPQMSDLSELISGHPGDATRFSRKRTSGGFSKTHKPLDSIPIPHDERAILMAMKLLQDKVEALEGSKAEAEQQCMHLEHELRRNETRLRQEQHRAKAAEDGLLRKRGGDSAFGGSNDGDAEERAKEKMKLEHQMEKLKLETTINSLHTQLDILTRELETSKIALRHMQEERNSAINSVAMAISTNEDLKAVNEELRLEIAHLRQGRSGNDLKDEEWKTREDRLRRKAREAREAAAIAEVFARETTRREKSKEAAANEESARAERREQRAREKEAEKARERLDVEEKKIAQEQRAKERLALQKERFDKMVEHQLRKLRPDLFTGESDIPAALPLAVNRVSVPEPVRPRTQAQRKGKKDTRSNEAHGYHATSDNEDAQGTQTTSKDNEPKELSNGDDTVMSISPDEIKRIAKEINAERRKRKVVAANAAQEPAPSTQKPKHQAKKAAKPKTSMKKPTKASAPSTEKTEEITAPVSPKLDTSNKPAKTVRIAKTDKGKGKAVDNSAQVTATLPAQPQVQPQASTVAVSSDAAVQASQTYRRPKRRRVVKKVVYYYDEETTMSFPVEEEVEEEVSESEDEETETLNGQARQQLPEPEHEEHTSHEEMSYEDPMTLQESMILPEAPPVAAASPQAVAAQPAPREQEHDAQSLVDHLAEHDPESCTVCKRIQKLRQKEQEQRMANPLADIDNSMAFPAPALQPVSTRRLENTGSYEEEATPRPSQEPKTQLSKVVRQLQDEFAHIKLTYQNKAEEFMSLDPSMGKRRRKALTGEMNELVAEMDYKCDQIYALYDVNEEFDGRMDSEDDDEDEEGEEEGEEEGDEEEDDADLTEWTIPESSVLEHEGGDEDTEGSVDEEER